MEQNWLDKVSPQIHLLWKGSMAPSWIEPPRYLYEHQLAVITEGKCLIQINGESLTCEEGTYMIIPPNKLHSAAAFSGNGFSTYSIHFDWVLSTLPFSDKYCVYHPNTIPAAELHLPPPFIPKQLLWGKIIPKREVTELLQELAYRWQSPFPHFQISCRGILLQILLLILASNKGNQYKIQKSNYLANEIKILLQKSFNKVISIQDTLESLGYSYPHLCRIFTKTYGISPIEYLNGLRVEHAKRLILTTHCRIKEAAYKSGFNDARYFSRVFKQLNGCSPVSFMLKMNLNSLNDGLLTRK